VDSVSALDQVILSNQLQFYMIVALCIRSPAWVGQEF